MIEVKAAIFTLYRSRIDFSEEKDCELRINSALMQGYVHLLIKLLCAFTNIRDRSNPHLAYS